MSNSFPKTLRILKSGDFDRVFAQRQSRADRLLVVYGCANDLDHPRMGLVVSRKCGNAVARNRWKRCLREAFRQVHRGLPAGIDLAFIPRTGATPDVVQLKRSITRLASELNNRLAHS